KPALSVPNSAPASDTPRRASRRSAGRTVLDRNGNFSSSAMPAAWSHKNRRRFMSTSPGTIAVSDFHDPSYYAEQYPPTVEILDGIQPSRGVDGMDEAVAILCRQSLELDGKAIVLRPYHAGRQSAHTVEDHVQRCSDRQGAGAGQQSSRYRQIDQAT